MTYEQKAEIFKNLIATTGSVPEALRLLDQELWRLRTAKLAAHQLDEIRRLRAEGELTLQEIADQFDITASRVSQICRGIGCPSRALPPITQHPLGQAIDREVARLLDLPETWLADARRGKEPPRIQLARRVGLLAMRQGGMSWGQIGNHLRRERATVTWRYERAERDRRARDLAEVVLAEARQRVQLASGAPTAEMALVEQGRAA